MRKLIALCALLLSTSVAMAQADKNPAVTKLPGEEKLSVRERAERDFLMPTRHKKMAEVAKAIAADQEDATASPELDATAHYTEAIEARPEDVAVVTHTERHTSLRHYSHTRSTRHRSKATTTKRHAAAKKTTAHRSTKTKAKTKKATATKHTTAKKKVTKAKASSHKKRRR